MINIGRVILVFSFVLFGLTSIMTLQDGHNWGDDFAQYILHALNLVEHKPYAENIVLDLWTVVPPGFPLILASIIYWFGINLKVLKLLNIFFWALTALASYFLALQRIKPALATALTVWFLSLPAFFFLKQNVLSDIPFMCLVSMSLWSFMRYETKRGDRSSERFYYSLSVVLMSYALMVRWAGVTLIFSALLYFLIKGDLKRSIGFLLGACVSVFFGIYLGATFGGHFGGTQLVLNEWLNTIWMNTALIPKVFFDVIITQPHVSKSLGPTIFMIFKFLGPVMFLACGIFFLYRLSRKQISFLGCFTFIYILGMVLWPVQQGLSRYILPIVIPAVIYLLSGTQKIWARPVTEKFFIGVFVVLIFQNILVIGMNWKFDDDEIYRSETLKMANWVIDNIRTEEHYMFYKPRALRLLTNRVGTAYWVYPEDEQFWHLRAQRLDIKYFIADKKIDQLAQYDALVLPVENKELNLQKVWENTQYKIFAVK